MSKATGKAHHPHDASRPESAAVRRALESGDIEELRLALSPRQRRFAEEYIIDFNGAAAAVRAGYSVNYSDRQAHLLLRHKGISALIDHLAREKADSITAVDADYIVQGIVAIINKEAGRDTDKLRGYELLARLKGLFIDKQEITGKDGGAIEIEKRNIQEEADNFIGAIKALKERVKKEEKKEEITLV